METKKIFITGPSGMGKTTLAKWISERYNIPYISTSAKDIWPDYGIRNHRDAHVLPTVNEKAGVDYQLDVLNRRILALGHDSQWVTDRSPIDNFVYFMLEVSPYIDSETSERFLDKCRMAMKMGTHLVIIPYKDDIQLGDGFRIDNSYYQQMVSRIMEWALWGLGLGVDKNTVTINHWNMIARKQIIETWLGNF